MFIASRVSIFSKKNIRKNYNYNTAKNLLKCGIEHYKNNNTADSYKCLIRITKDDVNGRRPDKITKAIAHLYIAKSQMLGSSKSERLAIDNLRKAKAFFDTSRRYKRKYFFELQNEYEKIDSIYGSIDNYQKILENRLNAIGIKFRSE